MIDTARILVGWACNLKCTYCCNEQERFRKDILPTTLDKINWSQYNVFCVSGGEPLLAIGRIKEVCDRIPKGKLVILYTNGILLTSALAVLCESIGIAGMNIGLHYPATYDRLIKSVTEATKNTTMKIRFHAQDIYEKELTTKYPNVSFRFWKMDDCDRVNEDRFVLS